MNFKRLQAHNASLRLHVWPESAVLLPGRSVLPVPVVAVIQIRVRLFCFVRMVRWRLATLDERVLSFVRAGVRDALLAFVDVDARGKPSTLFPRGWLVKTERIFATHYFIHVRRSCRFQPR